MSARHNKSHDINLHNIKRTAIIVAWCACVLTVVVLIAHSLWQRHRQQGLNEAQNQQRNELQQLNIAPSVTDTLVLYRGFQVHFNSKWHVPNCVVYELTASEAKGALARYGSFETDRSIQGCATPADYIGSNYDRGHMAPAGDFRWDKAAMDASFKMTNVCPQDRALNSGGWSRLEDKVREWAERDEALLVFTGPIVKPRHATIGKQHVAVPEAFFKVIVAHRTKPMRAIAFIYPNSNAQGRLEKYAVTVRAVEDATGIDFLPTLSRSEQQRLESDVNLQPWLHTN